MAEVVVVGSVHVDLIATAPRLPRRGETLPGFRFATHPGGKGGNQAAQAALQGSATTLVGRVGRDEFGERLLQALRARGVSTDHVWIDDEAVTGASTVLVGEDGDYASVIVPAASMLVDEAQLEAAAPTVAGCHVLLAQLEIRPETTAYAVRMAKRLGTSVILNAAPAPEDLSVYPASFWGGLDVLVVNQGEAETLSGVSDGTSASSEEVALLLRKRLGVPVVVMTLGAAGAIVSERTGERRVAGWPVPVVDAVGAGDAFVGTLASRLASGVRLDAAVFEANAAGALAVTKAGAYDALPSAADLRRFLAKRSATPNGGHEAQPEQPVR